MEHPNYKEPWNYGDEAVRIFKKYDELRYQFIPYLYSHSYENHTTGVPLMRALVLNYQDDENVYDITDQYMLGESLMICPVTEKGAKTRVVYLPKGTWTDYWTGEIYEGRCHYSVLCELDKLPIFIKEGAIIPKQEVLQYIGEKEISKLIIDIYPNASNSFTIYNDDGKTVGYKMGAFNTTSIVSNVSDKEIDLTLDATKGDFKGQTINYEINLHLAKQPKQIIINGKSAEGAYSSETHILKIIPKQSNRETIEIKIKK